MIVDQMSLGNEDEDDDEYEFEERCMILYSSSCSSSSSIMIFLRRHIRRTLLNQAICLENRSTRLTYCRVSA
jgi:hypothetical protein